MRAPKKPLKQPRIIKGTRRTIIAQDKALVHMHLFFRTVDWGAYWKDWFLSVTPEGHQKYRSIRQFAKEKAESREQLAFLEWYLGAKDENDPLNQKFKFVPDGPVDWIKRRSTGGWHSRENLQQFTAEIKRRDNALEALQETGNKVTLNAIARFENLAQRVDSFFNGEPLVAGLSFKENSDRANLYIRLQERLLAFQERAFALYAKSHGVNFEDMSGLVQLYTASAMAAAQRTVAGESLTREQKAIQGLVEMTLTKASRYNLPLPADAEAKIIDVNAEIEKKKAKRGVQ